MTEQEIHDAANAARFILSKPWSFDANATYKGAAKALIAASDLLKAKDAEIDELRKDKERLDWLQSHTRISSLQMNGQHRYSMRFAVQECLRGPTFRAAIDEAMK